MAGERFDVRFWGVRGSIACPGSDTLKFGGNTSCVEMRCGDHVLVFDAGTGIRDLGDDLAARDVGAIDLFFSHTHMDHIVGLPFFWFAHVPTNALRVWSGHLGPESTIKEALGQYMHPPVFPVPVEIFKARIEFVDFGAGEDLTPHPGIRVRTAPLNHPNRATGYRVEYAGKSICYITDTEHVEGTDDRNVLSLIENADIVIYDSTFTPDEYKRCIGWGHSTWEEGVRLCRLAGVKKFVPFHHLPGRTDKAMSALEAKIKRAFPDTAMAREGMILTP